MFCHRNSVTDLYICCIKYGDNKNTSRQRCFSRSGSRRRILICWPMVKRRRCVPNHCTILFHYKDKLYHYRKKSRNSHIMVERNC